MNKRGKIKIGLTVFIILIFTIFLSQIQNVKTLSYEEEMNLKYSVKPAQTASIGRGGGVETD